MTVPARPPCRIGRGAGAVDIRQRGDRVGVSTSLAVRIYKQYGDAATEVVTKEPYRLAADVWRHRFKTADTIAQAVGIPHDSPQRVMAGLQYTLSAVYLVPFHRAEQSLANSLHRLLGTPPTGCPTS